MSSQYDKIGLVYNELKSLPSSRILHVNVRDAVAPYVKGAKVLDLACGTGYYTRALLEWGAKEVVGMDISPEMIKVAKAEVEQAALAEGQKYSFTVGDASQPFKWEGGPFDLVVGVWLLNYAPNAEVMTRMWQNIVNNLRPGGCFVGVTPPPESGIDAVRKNIEHHQGPVRGVSVHIVEEVPNGFKTKTCIQRGSSSFEFESYHLQKEVYESSAQEGGVQGTFRWRPIKRPESEEEFQQLSTGLDAGFWDRYFKAPHCGMVVVER